MTETPHADKKPSIFETVVEEQWEEPDDDPGEAGFPAEGPLI